MIIKKSPSWMIVIASILLGIGVFSIIPRYQNIWFQYFYIPLFVGILIFVCYLAIYFNNKLSNKVAITAEAKIHHILSIEQKSVLRKIVWYLVLGSLFSVYLASDLAELKGAGRAQGEFILIIPFLLNFIVGIYFLILNFKAPLNSKVWYKRYILEITGSMFFMFSWIPLFVEDSMREFLKLDYMNRFSVCILPLITIYFVIFNRPIRHFIRGKL